MAVKVTLRRPSVPDRFGQSTGPDINERVYPILGHWQESTTELIDGAATTVDVRYVVLPPKANVSEEDILILHGERYEVDGKPNLLEWETGQREGWQVRIRRAVG